MFKRFASLIALQLDSEMSRQQDQSALRDAHADSELREQFIAILGHDLRNPLQAVYAAGVLLEKKVADPVLKDVASRIRVNVKRMSSLINDVLDFARSRLGEGMGVRMAEVEDIDTGLKAVVREFQDGQPDRQILANISVTRQSALRFGTRAAGRVESDRQRAEARRAPESGQSFRPGGRRRFRSQCLECRRTHTARESRQDMRALLAPVNVGKPRRVGVGTLYLFANRARSWRHPVRDIHAGKRHELYGAPAAKFRSS